MDSKSYTRRALLGHFGIGTAALAAVATLPLGLVANPQEAEASWRSANDLEVAVLNFALNLEYLEAEFYSYAVTGEGLPSSLTSGQGREGATTGGTLVNFVDNGVKALAQELYKDEVAHVKFLRKVLGKKAIGKPAIKLDPLGSYASENAFLTYSRAFEDTGVSAYGGAAPLLKTPSVIRSAARILSVESYHAGAIRYVIAQRRLSVPPLDSRDQIPTSDNIVPTASNALSITRDTKQVKSIVTPFFPSGINGQIK